MQKENVKLGIRQMQLHLHRQWYQILLFSKSYAYITYVWWMVLRLLQRNLVVVDEFVKTWPEKTTNGYKKPKKTQVLFALWATSICLGSSKHACHSTCQDFRMDSKDLIAMIREYFALPNFSTAERDRSTTKKDFTLSRFSTSLEDMTILLNLQLGLLEIFVENFILLVVLFLYGFIDYFKFE